MKMISLAILLAATLLAQSPPHHFFRVVLSPQFSHPFSGRLLVFVRRGGEGKDIDLSPFDPGDGAVAAKEIHDLAPGGSVEIDVDDISYPAPFSQLRPGEYRAQAVLDVDHSYNYLGRVPGDLVSKAVEIGDLKTGPAPSIFLETAVPETQPTALDPAVHVEAFQSPVLSNFFHRPVYLRALVVEPPNYGSDLSARFPAVYFTHGFEGNLERLRGHADHVSEWMKKKQMPEMVWIMLDESLPTGTHEFADSANNGPWGTALTQEFIPYLEAHYRLDRRSGARFLTGHSSGGWATLWLQVAYPKIFGGTWSTSPDPSDFHDFSGVNLYAPHANLYRRPDGTPNPIVRGAGKIIGTMQQFAQMEQALGPYGGQFASFEWVFSPRGADGQPLQFFDRTTGDVDPKVIAAWQQYDICHKLVTEWPRTGPDLRGKIHVFVGTADTFYLDGPAHKLDQTLQSLQADGHVEFIEGRTHMNLYQTEAGPNGLAFRIANEMYATWKRTS